MRHALVAGGARRVSLPGLLVALFLAGCSGGDRALQQVAPVADQRVTKTVAVPDDRAAVGLTLTSVARGAREGGAMPAALVGVVRKEAERNALLACLNPERPEQIAAVDLAGNVMIVAVLGTRPSSGYGIEIIAAEVRGRVLQIGVKVTAPAPGTPVSLGFEMPYHVVSTAKGALPEGVAMSYVLADASGATLGAGMLVAAECSQDSPVR